MFAKVAALVRVQSVLKLRDNSSSQSTLYVSETDGKLHFHFQLVSQLYHKSHKFIDSLEIESLFILYLLKYCITHFPTHCLLQAQQKHIYCDPPLSMAELSTVTVTSVKHGLKIVNGKFQK